MHTTSQPAAQGTSQLQEGDFASIMQRAVTQQVTAWNPKPSLFLPKKRSLELRMLTACRSLDRGRAGRPRRAGPPGRTGSPSQPGYF